MRVRKLIQQHQVTLLVAQRYKPLYLALPAVWVAPFL